MIRGSRTIQLPEKTATMPRKKRGTDLEYWRTHRPEARAGKLRIVGGKYRGRQLTYSGDPRTRPMKDNIREAVFNLIGGFLQDKHVFDLFSGTGAIGLEALSRGAAHTTLIERHFPTAKVIRDNIAELAVESQTTVVTSDTFFWSRRFLSDPAQFPTMPWAVFCSPPYDLYVSKKQELLSMLNGLIDAAPKNSLFVVECDERLVPDELRHPADWKIRQYAPAQVCLLTIQAGNSD